jgi:hypothetical protein
MNSFHNSLRAAPALQATSKVSLRDAIINPLDRLSLEFGFKKDITSREVLLAKTKGGSTGWRVLPFLMWRFQLAEQTDAIDLQFQSSFLCSRMR